MKVSVVMAVYNAAGSVGRMIESLLNQSLSDLEVILVDDGSTDGSAEICDGYVSRDHRVKVIHKANEGVSSARQTGLDTAVGEYVIHADADDYVEAGMLEQLYRKAKEEDADVVFCDYFIDDLDGNITIRRQQPPFDASQTLRAMFDRLYGSCWNKLVRRSCFDKYGICFPVGLNYCEDLLIWAQLFQHPEIRISYVNRAFYHYVANPNSVTRGGSHTMLENIRLFTSRMAEVLPVGDPDIDAYVAKLPIAPFLYAFLNRLVSGKESRKEYKKLRKVVWNDTDSLRWKLGYLCMDFNLMFLARKLIKL